MWPPFEPHLNFFLRVGMSIGGWKCTRIQQNSRNIEPIDQWPMANGHGGNLVSHSQLRITGRLTMVLKGLSPKKNWIKKKVSCSVSFALHPSESNKHFISTIVHSFIIDKKVARTQITSKLYRARAYCLVMVVIRIQGTPLRLNTYQVDKSALFNNIDY